MKEVLLKTWSRLLDERSGVGMLSCKPREDRKRQATEHGVWGRGDVSG